MKKFYHCLVCIGLSGTQLYFLPGCKKDESIRISAAKPEKKLLDKIDVSPYTRFNTVQLYKDTVYVIEHDFIREAGEQLIIEEGTVIKVKSEGARRGIIIKPGGVIIANGNPSNPIVFTSTSLPGNQKSNWNGLTIEGNGVNNSTNPSGDQEDFSGTLNYVRIEFGGLILNSVGQRTTLSNIQVSYAEDRSSFEISGGNFNARNLVSYACGGAADYYITKGYTGNMQNILAYRHPFFGKGGSVPYNALAGVFIENNPDDPQAVPNSHPIISNLSVIGPDGQNGSAIAYSDTSSSFRSAALVTAGNAFFHIRNSLFLGFPVAAWYIEDGLTAYNVNFNHAQVTHSVFHCNNSSRAFYIRDGVYPPNTSVEFKNFALREQYRNKLFDKSADFMLQDPFNYDAPMLFPLNNSPVLDTANFEGPNFDDAFFDKVNYKGAAGKENWLSGWTNFTPLKTNYNFPG
jgi:hypothetical protein